MSIIIDMTANINGLSGLDLHFSLASLDALDATEDRHFWSVVKRRLITGLIRRHTHKKHLHICDIGCGNGGLLQHLERVFPTASLTGIDGYPQALLHCRKRTGRATLIRGNILDLEHMPLLEKFDVVILADVLEHLDNPECVLRGVQATLAPGGIAIATVPASRFLWSDRDVFLGHRKRYARPELVALFRASGFDVLRSNYAFCYLYPPTFLFRRVLAKLTGKAGGKIEEEELHEIPVINTLLCWIGSGEAALSRYVPLPFGTSTYCVARVGQSSHQHVYSHQ